MTDVQLKPEQRAPLILDEKLVQAGWLIQNYRNIDLTAGRGIALREFPTAGPVDYVLYLDRKAIGG